MSQRVVLGTLAGATPGVIAAAGNYAAGDVLSQSADNGVGVAWVFDEMCGPKKSGTIKKALITCSAQGVLAQFRLWLFKENPSASELDDNAAFELAAADRTKLVGFIAFAAMADHGAVSLSQKLDANLPFKCADDDDALYGILQTIDAETNEAAGMTVTIELHAEVD